MAKKDVCCNDFNRSVEINEKSKQLRVLELYSGIGGMHFSLQKANIPHFIVGAYDINTVANQIYKFNFPNSNHYQRNILSLTIKEIDDMKVDLLVMSPPCQPFTRLGLKQDCHDSRSSSFLHILNLIKHIQYKPNYILVENVKGFEISETRKIMLDVLIECRYTFQEFLLNPLQLGIPNSRLRYYLLAKKAPLEFCFTVSDSILMEFVKMTSCSDSAKCEKLESYLDYQESTNSYLIPDKILLKYAVVFDIVDANACNCCCFTKAYTHYFQGTGSILRQNCEVNMSEIFNKVLNQQLNETEKLNLLKLLQLRYFTPQEIANLMCFPKHFKFPYSITRRQRYQVLGNSINVGVVSKLLRLLLNDNLLDES